MILEKKPLPDDPTHLDAPPSYDQLVSSSYSKFSSGKGDTGSLESSPRVTASTSTHRPHIGPRISATRSRGVRSSSSGKGGLSAWLTFPPFGQASSTASDKGRAELRATVLGLVRDLVIQQNSETTGGMFSSCLNACEKHDISFSEILQERSIEGHTPLYWAVVKRPKSQHRRRLTNTPDEEEELLFRLLKYTIPLSPVTLSELRRACLDAGDNVLLQRLRAAPAVVPLRGLDAMLVDTGDPSTIVDGIEGRAAFADLVEVEDGKDGDATAFAVNLELKMFQRRMRISKEIRVEFIARGRLWSLTFFVLPELRTASTRREKKRLTRLSTPSSTSNAPQSCVPPSSIAVARRKGCAPGVWVLSVGLLEHSAPSWLDARFIVSEPLESRLPPQEQLPPPLPPRQNSSTDKPTINNALPGQSRNPFLMANYTSGLNSSTPTSPSSFQPPPIRTQRPLRKAKPDIILEIKSPDQIFPQSLPDAKNEPRSSSRSSDVLTDIVVSFEENQAASGLQYDGCTYLLPDGTLRAVFQARITKPEAQCIVM